MFSYQKEVQWSMGEGQCQHDSRRMGAKLQKEFQVEEENEEVLRKQFEWTSTNIHNQ